MANTIIVVHQDRDEFFKYNKKENKLTSKAIMFNSRFIGFNLYIDGKHNIGTFEDEEEIAKEIKKINKCKFVIHFVSGHSEGVHLL